MFKDSAFDLLAGLEADNSKDWFDAHRDEVRKQLQEPFAAALVAISEKLAETDVPLSGGEKTMFRMNRDVRFSNDKSPYSTHLSGLLTRSGSKGEADGVAYLHIDRHGGFVAVGWYKLTPKELGPIRDRMVEHPDKLKAVVEALAAHSLELSDEQSLTAMPRGYAEHADSDVAPYLKLQTLMVQRDLPKAAWKSGGAVDRVAELVTSCAPLLAFGRP